MGVQLQYDLDLTNWFGPMSLIMQVCQIAADGIMKQQEVAHKIVDGVIMNYSITHKRLENARVENGNLIIEARKEKMGDAGYTSSRLVSKNKGDWKYGRFEIKAKIPAGKGMWPAIWMLPTHWEYGKWPQSGEIDIMENVGYYPDSLFGSIHTGAYNGMIGTQKTKGVLRKDLSTAFHVYAIEWTEQKISFFIDGQMYHEFLNNNTGSEAWPYDKYFHLLLNIAVGGNWGGKYGVDDSVFPQKMLIDYVRVYQ